MCFLIRHARVFKLEPVGGFDAIDLKDAASHAVILGHALHIDGDGDCGTLASFDYIDEDDAGSVSAGDEDDDDAADLIGEVTKMVVDEAKAMARASRQAQSDNAIRSDRITADLKKHLGNAQMETLPQPQLLLLLRRKTPTPTATPRSLLLRPSFAARSSASKYVVVGATFFLLFRSGTSD